MKPEEALFGQIAIKLKMLTMAQLGECFGYQQAEEHPPPLGEVCIARGYLTRADVEQVLREQKRMLASFYASKEGAPATGAQHHRGADARGENARGPEPAADARRDRQEPSPRVRPAARAEPDGRRRAAIGRAELESPRRAAHAARPERTRQGGREEPLARGSDRGTSTVDAPPARGNDRGAPTVDAPPARGSDRGAPASERERERRRAAAAMLRGAGADGPPTPRQPGIRPPRGELGPVSQPGQVTAAEPYLDPYRDVPFRSPDAAPNQLDAWLADARARGASDLHLISERPILLRIAGELLPQGEVVPAHVVEPLLLAEVRPDLRRTLHAEGSCDCALDRPTFGRVRANVSRMMSGLKGCFRLIPGDVPTLASLGLPEQIGRATDHHQGLIVITGPAGHGKTTTLAAIVDIINRDRSHHVITVEDPIEFLHPPRRALMSQREVGTHTRSFQAALKGALREDPDVIVVGELRDAATVKMALAAAETGHLVLGTMNTQSAAKTIDRLIDMFPPADQPQVRLMLAGGLRLVVSQRLIRRADGAGVVAAAEVLPGVLPLWNLIREGRTFQIASLQQRGRSMGIIRLDDALMDLVSSGQVSAQDAASYAENPEQFGQGAARRAAPAAEVRPPAPEPEGRGLFERAGALLGLGRRGDGAGD